MDVARRTNEEDESRTLRRQVAERKQFAKVQKVAARSRTSLFRDGLRLHPGSLSVEQARDRIKKVTVYFILSAVQILSQLYRRSFECIQTDMAA